MLHPVGSQPPSVYWRRRLVLIGGIALVIVLLALTISALSGSDGGPSASGGSSSPPVAPASTPQSTDSLSDPASSTGSGSTTNGSGSGSPSGSGSGSSAAPVACTTKQLDLSAVVAQSSYQVGASPLLGIKIENVGSAPCIADLSDKQIVLRVYNGTSRVWGSHDCAVQPGSDSSVLAVGKPALRQIEWNGLTSQPGCSQVTRQRVGAGSYTLYASLAGRSARAAQFSIG